MAASARYLFLALLALATGAPPARAAGPLEACLANKFPTSQLNCLNQAAQAAGDVKLCLLSDRPELCAGLATPNLGDACYLQMVEAGAEEALCARIENAIIKSACGGE